MKDPRRLLEEDASALERSLLCAALAEEAPLGAETRLAAALGVPSLLSLTSGAAVAHTSVAPPATASGLGGMGGNVAPGALATGVLKTLAGKLVLAGLLAGVGTTLLVMWTSPHAPSTPVSPPRHEESPAAADAKSELIPTLSKPVPDVSDHRTPAPSIAREVAALDAVQALVQAKRASAALMALDRYDADHPQSVLAQEAHVLRIEALLQGGAVAKARALAERFLHEHVQSPHAARVRALLRQVSARP